MTLPNNNIKHNSKISMGYLTVLGGIVGQTSITMDYLATIVLILGLFILVYSYSIEV